MAHPLYVDFADSWRKLAHVYEGTGGFMDGTYIVPHAREWEDHSIAITTTAADGTTTVTGYQTNPNPSKPTAKLKERRKIARYENIAATIVDQKVSALFRQEPTRAVKGGGEHPWLDWSEDVDGHGTCLTDWLHDAMIAAMVFGSNICVMDRPQSDTPPKTMAEMKAPFLRAYTPLDMPDWIDDVTGRLTAVKLVECVRRTDLRQGSTLAVSQRRVRLIDETSWELIDESFTRNGKMKSSQTVSQGQHQFGTLPVVVLYAKRRALIPVIGQSVLHDPQLFIDLYNLTSELRELFRKQTFSILNVPLGTGPDAMDVERAKQLLGQAVGTANVLFSGTQVAYVSPDANNVASYQKEIERLARLIFRLCSVPWEADSRDAESEGSMKLKREDMNQVLSGYATRLEKAEYELAELFFRAQYGAAGWQKAWDEAEPIIRYDRTFDVTPFADMLEQAQAALALPLGQSKTFLFELAMRLLPLFLTNADETTMATIASELEKLPDPQEVKAQRLQQLTTAFAKTPLAGAQQAAEEQSGQAQAPGQKVAA